MPDIYQQGIVLPGPVAPFLPKTQFGVAQSWFVNRTPLTSRLPVAPVKNISFNMVGYRFRPRTLALAATITTGDTTFTVSDASILMNGDVLQMSTGEVVEVVGAPNIAANTITVRRAVGTSQAIGAKTYTPTVATAVASLTHPAEVITNIGNSRTGGETNQLAISQIPTTVTQYVQTFQHVVQVAGVMADIEAFPYPGMVGPFPKNRMDALQNFMDDVEETVLYGVGEALGGANSRPKMYGLCNLIQTNNITASNPSAYKPSDFINDAFTPILQNGGQPSLVLASIDFQAGLATWGGHLQYTTPGMTEYGTSISMLFSPFLGGVPVVYDMFLKRGTALVLTVEEVRMRMARSPEYKEYGRRGDTGDGTNSGEGDWVGRLAIELDNESHHAYIQGITAFAPAA